VVPCMHASVARAGWVSSSLRTWTRPLSLSHLSSHHDDHHYHHGRSIARLDTHASHDLLSRHPAERTNPRKEMNEWTDEWASTSTSTSTSTSLSLWIGNDCAMTVCVLCYVTALSRWMTFFFFMTDCVDCGRTVDGLWMDGGCGCGCRCRLAGRQTDRSGGIFGWENGRGEARQRGRREEGRRAAPESDGSWMKYG